MKEQKNILKNIRLKDFQIKAIKNAVKKFDENAKIYIFGSRIDLNKKGGDIDLLVLSKKITFDIKLKILAILYKQIGEQKIDLIIAKNKDESSFVQEILSKGVEL
jgi:predicted nucleotidyltransferase